MVGADKTDDGLANRTDHPIGMSRRRFVAGGLVSLGHCGTTAALAEAALPPDLLALWRQGESPAPLRLRRDGQWLVADLQSPAGQHYRARQRIGASSATAVCDDPRPMELFLFSGQSNAGGSPVETPRAENVTPFAGQPWFPNHVFQMEAGLAGYGRDAPPSRGLDELVPAIEMPKYGVFPQTTFMMALELLARAKGKLGPGYAARTDWFGDQPLETFLDGGEQFRKTLASAKALAGFPANYARKARLGAFVFIQGETPGVARRGDHAKLLQAHFSSMRQALAKRTGLDAPPVLYLQINQGSSYPKPTGNELAELESHRAGGKPHFLIGPMYHHPLVVQGKPETPSIIHESVLGKLMLGETLALAYRQIARTGSFDPLRPLRAALEGRALTLTFAVPPGARLAFDSDWITARPSGEAGFTVSSGGATIAIEAVAIEGKDRVTLRLAARKRAEPLTIRYALDPRLVDWRGATPGDSRFAPSTGTLMAETDSPSPFAQRGFAVPKRIRHYCVRFSLDVI